MSKYESLPGEKIAKENLALQKSIEFVKAVELCPFAELVEIKKNSDSDEIIIVNLEVEIPQRPKHDIRKNERIGIMFYNSDNVIPEVLALRTDFPLVPHTNLRLSETPKSLCLFEESYAELKLKWSSYFFLERIRDWLRLTAKGIVHAANQSLEPLLGFNTNFLILPTNFYETNNDQLILAEVVKSNGIQTIITGGLKTKEKISPGNNYIFAVFSGQPQVHGVIKHAPLSIKDLSEFLQSAGIQFINELRIRLKNWFNDRDSIPLFDLKLIIVINLPKKRENEQDIEQIDIRAFLTDISVRKIGEEIGIWQSVDGKIGQLLQEDLTKDGSVIKIEMLNTVDPFTIPYAQVLNNCPSSKLKITSIGSGSLGSQIFNILIRQGLGNWTLIDNDIILPHNLGRHILQREHIGKHKAQVLSDFANSLFNVEGIADYLTLNILDEENPKQEQAKTKLQESNIILDFSASVPVERYLTNDINSDASRISSFFTPSGRDSVLLAEDLDREHKLDMLEMQYYRMILNNEELKDHLYFPENTIRYGYSCRDISSRIPFDLTAQHAAVCSTEIKKIISDQKARISIWRTDPDNGIKKYSGKIYKEIRLNFGDWSLVYDEYVITKILNERENKLPNETGGVLIGSYDMQRKIIYVVDSLNSPEDSIEWPTVYIRGIKGLKKQVERIEKITHGMLTYLGEWHSHPAGCYSRPSNDDIKAFTWLTEVLNESGLQALMLIVGEDTTFYLGEIIE